MNALGPLDDELEGDVLPAERAAALEGLEPRLREEAAHGARVEVEEVLGVLVVLPAPPQQAREERRHVLRLEDEPPVGSEEAARLPQHGDRIGDVLDDVPERDEVEGRAGELLLL